MKQPSRGVWDDREPLPSFRDPQYSFKREFSRFFELLIFKKVGFATDVFQRLSRRMRPVSPAAVVDDDFEALSNEPLEQRCMLNSASPIDVDSAASPILEQYEIRYENGHQDSNSVYNKTANAQNKNFSDSGPRVVGVAVQSSSTGFAYDIPFGDEQRNPIPWNDLDQISIEFDRSVFLNQDLLEFSGVQSGQFEIASLSLNGESTTATWQFLSKLTSDRFLLELSDLVVDELGNRLDGNFWNGKSERSGNGIPGSNFRFSFGVLVGDVNQDGTTSVSDYAAVQSQIGQAPPSIYADINTDGLVNSLDLESVTYGDFKGLEDPTRSLLVTQVQPTENVSTNIVAVSQTDEDARLFVYQGNSGQELASSNLNNSFQFVDIEPVVSANGYGSAVAILGVHRISGGIRVWVWDMESESVASSISFNGSKIAEDLEVYFDSQTLTTSVAVLTRTPNTNGTRVYFAGIDDLSTTNSMSFGGGFAGFDLEIQDTNGEPHFSVAGKTVTGGVVSKTSTKLGDQISRISYGIVDPVDFEVFDDSKNNTTYALLRKQSAGNRAFVDLRNPIGDRLGLIRRSKKNLPVNLEINAGGTQTRIAILTEHESHFENVVYSSYEDGSDATVTSFGSGWQATSLTYLPNANGDEQVAVSQINFTIGVSQIKIRDLTNKKRVRTIPVDAQPIGEHWFKSNRVQGHTRLGMVDPRQGLERSYYRSNESEIAAAEFKNLGANVFTRHAVTMDEDPWWPSEVPVGDDGVSVLDAERNNRGIELGERENLVQQFVNSAWESRIPAMAYYWHISDARMSTDNPQWHCLDQHGTPNGHVYKGDYLDITSNYGDIVLQRLLEIADMGWSGIYLDGSHMPLGGCWGTQLADDFLEETGIEAPPIGNTVEYLSFMEFMNRRTGEVLRNWEEKLEAEYPHVQLLVGHTTVTGLTRVDMDSSLLDIGNPKSEFALATRRGWNNSVFVRFPDLYEPPHDVRMALGWTLLRDSTNGIPHVWNAFTPNRDHLLAFVGSVAAYGSVAALDVLEELIPPDGELENFSTREDMAAGFDLGDRLSPHLSDAEPVKWAAVLFSEEIRNKRKFDQRKAWEEVISPTVGAFQSVQQLQKPVGIITDSQLAEGITGKFQVLILSNPNELTAEQSQKVVDFVAGGGTVIESEPTWDWSTQAGYNEAVGQIQAQLNAVTNIAPITVSNLPPLSHSVGYRKAASNNQASSTAIAVVNDFTFSQSTTVFDPIDPEDVNPTPENIPAGAKVFVSDTLDPIYAELTASDLIAIDVVTGNELEIVRVANGFQIDLQEIERISLVVVELR